MKRLLFFAVLLCLIVSPACAVSYVEVYPHGVDLLGDGSADEKVFENVYAVAWNGYEDPKTPMGIKYASFDVPINSDFQFTISYGNGSSVSGSVTHTLGGLGYLTSTITLGGESDEHTYIPIMGVLSGHEIYAIGYGRDADLLLTNNASAPQGILLFSEQYGDTPVIGNNHAVLYETSDPQNDIITGITASCDQPFTISMMIGSISGTSLLAGQTPFEMINEWVSFALQISTAVLGFLMMVLGLIKFFFIDNLLLIIALWLSVSMAYSAISSKNIFMFYKKFFGFQRALFQFFAELWNYLIQILAAFRGIFRI